MSPIFKALETVNKNEKGLGAAIGKIAEVCQKKPLGGTVQVYGLAVEHCCSAKNEKSITACYNPADLGFVKAFVCLVQVF